MSRADDTRKTGPVVNIDGRNQVESQQREVGKMVPGEVFAAQVRVHASQAPKAIAGDAHALEIGHLDLSRIADNHIFNIAFAVDQRADLAIGFMRKLAQLPCEFRSDNLMGRNAALIQLLNAPQLIRLQTLRVTVKTSHPVDAEIITWHFGVRRPRALAVPSFEKFSAPPPRSLRLRGE